MNDMIKLTHKRKTMIAQSNSAAPLGGQQQAALSTLGGTMLGGGAPFEWHSNFNSVQQLAATEVAEAAKIRATSPRIIGGATAGSTSQQFTAVGAYYPQHHHTNSGGTNQNHRAQTAKH